MEYTPESRVETHESVKKKRERESKEFVLKKHRNHFIDFSIKEKNLNQNQSDNTLVMMVVLLIAMNPSK
jgi:hypothetical protein